MCYLRRKFAEQFADFAVADRIYVGDTEAFHFDNISAEDVKLFLLEQTYISLVFISETEHLPVWQRPANLAVSPSG